MAKIAFKKGSRANLPVAISEGTFYVTTDERALYLDINENTRVRIGDFQEFETLTALQENINRFEWYSTQGSSSTPDGNIQLNASGTTYHSECAPVGLDWHALLLH